MKILFEHSDTFLGQKSPGQVKVIAINKENNNYCDVFSRFPYLKKLTKKEVDDFFYQLNFLVDEAIKGTINPTGIQYQQPIAENIREKYKEYFK